MRSINIDPQAFCNLLRGTHALNKPVGYCADQHGTVYTIFVATDKDSGAIKTSRDGKRIKFNIRKSLNQPEKDQSAQAVGQAQNLGAVLPGVQVQAAPAPAAQPTQAAAPTLDLSNLPF